MAWHPVASTAVFVSIHRDLPALIMVGAGSRRNPHYPKV